jgi:hypothetical protein
MEPKLLGSISKCTALALCTPDGERIVAAGGSGPGSVRVVSGSEPVVLCRCAGCALLLLILLWLM